MTSKADESVRYGDVMQGAGRAWEGGGKENERSASGPELHMYVPRLPSCRIEYGHRVLVTVDSGKDIPVDESNPLASGPLSCLGFTATKKEDNGQRPRDLASIGAAWPGASRLTWWGGECALAGEDMWE